MIVRTVKNKDNPYFQLNRTAVDDGRLSYKAIGVHAYLMSKPDDWQVHERDLVNRHQDGQAAVRAGLAELISFGYMVRVQVRGAGERVSGWRIDVYESPDLNPYYSLGVSPEFVIERPHLENRNVDNSPDCENHNVDTIPDCDFPHVDFPQVGFPHVENRNSSDKELLVTIKDTQIELIEIGDAGAGAAVTPLLPADKAPDLKDHPAVIAYHDFHNRWPQTGQMKLIAESNPPIAEWVRALREWARRGYSPVNIGGVLDWAHHPSRMESKIGGGPARKGYASGEEIAKELSDLRGVAVAGPVVVDRSAFLDGDPAWLGLVSCLEDRHRREVRGLVSVEDAGGGVTAYTLMVSGDLGWWRSYGSKIARPYMPAKSILEFVADVRQEVTA